MRNLFICCDGTWNAPQDLDNGVPVPTNVVKFHQALAGRNGDIPQLAYYHTGIGADQTGLVRVISGAVGRGLDDILKSAYKWAADHYQPGDRLFIVGFSRGAYTARSLAGFITRLGLPRPGPDGAVPWKTVAAMFAIYAASRNRRTAGGFTPEEVRRRREAAGVASDASTLAEPDIHFVGVWDTVGALGLPLNGFIGKLARLLTRLHLLDSRAFHDTQLSERIRHAYHAIAMDERRTSFAPTLWADKRRHPQRPLTGHPDTDFVRTHRPPETVEQRWFPGVHRDVGGSYRETGLSDAALAWMMDRARACGAAFSPEMAAQVRGDFRDVQHDSYAASQDFMNSQPREVPNVTVPSVPYRGRVNETVSTEAEARHRSPPIRQAPYWPTVAVETTGLSAMAEASKPDDAIRVYARDFWNATGLYLQRGRYTILAKGEWMDSWFVVPAKGWWPFWNPVFLLAWPWLRIKRCRWFELVLQLADEDNPDVSGADRRMTTLRGRECNDHVVHEIRKPGYLYGFANDAIPWLGARDLFYRNNKGSVTIEVTYLGPLDDNRTR